MLVVTYTTSRSGKFVPSPQWKLWNQLGSGAEKSVAFLRSKAREYSSGCVRCWIVEELMSMS